MRNNHHMRTGQDGFTLLMAVLVTSLLLSIGLAIFNITLKELLLSRTNLDSQFAIYAADSGTECALFWDLKGRAFSTSTSVGSILCNNQGLTNDENDGGPFGGGGYGQVNTFTLPLNTQTEPCAVVSVVKTESPRRTTITSNGYNTCDPTSPRRVERTLRVTY